MFSPTSRIQQDCHCSISQFGLSPWVSVPVGFRGFPEFDGLASQCAKLDDYITDIPDENRTYHEEVLTLFSQSSMYLNLKGSHLLLTSMLCYLKLLPDVSVVGRGRTPGLFLLIGQMYCVFLQSRRVLYQHTRQQAY
jgi:hypothetical protein